MTGFRAMIGRASTRTLGTGASHDVIDVHWQAPATLFFGAIGTREIFEKLQAFALCGLEAGEFSISERPSDGSNWDKAQQGIVTTLIVHMERTKTNSSSVCNPIFLTGGNNSGSDFGHYRAEIIVFGFRILSASGGLSRCIPIVYLSRGVQTMCFGR